MGRNGISTLATAAPIIKGGISHFTGPTIEDLIGKKKLEELRTTSEFDNTSLMSATGIGVG
jgi:hypothetical protein